MSRNIGRILGTAALASLIGGLLMSYQWGHMAEPPRVKATPASSEMMELLRDEHLLITNMLKMQFASEKKQVETSEE